MLGMWWAMYWQHKNKSLGLGQITIKVWKTKSVKKDAFPKQALKQKTNITVQIDNATEDWSITKDSPDTLKELRRKELYWMYKLKTYAQYNLNERDVYKVF